MSKTVKKSIAWLLSAALVLTSMVTGAVPVKAAESCQKLYSLEDLTIVYNDGVEIGEQSADVTVINYEGQYQEIQYDIPEDLKSGVTGYSCVFRGNSSGWALKVMGTGAEQTVTTYGEDSVEKGEGITVASKIGIMNTVDGANTVYVENITFHVTSEYAEEHPEAKLTYALGELSGRGGYGYSIDSDHIEGFLWTYSGQYSEARYQIPTEVLDAGLIGFRCLSSGKVSLKYLDENDQLAVAYGQKELPASEIKEGQPDRIGIMNGAAAGAKTVIDGIIFTTEREIEEEDSPQDPGSESTQEPGTETDEPGTETDEPGTETDEPEVSAGISYETTYTLDLLEPEASWSIRSDPDDDTSEYLDFPVKIDPSTKVAEITFPHNGKNAWPQKFYKVPSEVIAAGVLDFTYKMTGDAVSVELLDSGRNRVSPDGSVLSNAVLFKFQAGTNTADKVIQVESITFITKERVNESSVGKETFESTFQLKDLTENWKNGITRTESPSSTERWTFAAGYSGIIFQIPDEVLSGLTECRLKFSDAGNNNKVSMSFRDKDNVWKDPVISNKYNSSVLKVTDSLQGDPAQIGFVNITNGNESDPNTGQPKAMENVVVENITFVYDKPLSGGGSTQDPGTDEPGTGTDEPGTGTDEPGTGTDEPEQDSTETITYTVDQLNLHGRYSAGVPVAGSKVTYQAVYNEYSLDLPEGVAFDKLESVTLKVSGQGGSLCVKFFDTTETGDGSLKPVCESFNHVGNTEYVFTKFPDTGMLKSIGLIAHIEDAEYPFDVTIEGLVLKVKKDQEPETDDPEVKPEDVILKDAMTKAQGEGFIVGTAICNEDLNDAKEMELVTRHFNALTIGNELKPQFILTYVYGDKYPANELQTVMLNGESLSVPKLDFSIAEKGLDYVYDWNKKNPENRIKVRGHVLVWHSQTPEWFFHEDYDSAKPYVDKATMALREEWYIKSVAEHFTGAGSKYKDLFYAWDVVNEAVSDWPGGYRKSAEEGEGTPSSWWAVFKSNQFITDAFVYANKYFPADIELYYNDYGDSAAKKSQDILTLLKDVKKTGGARIDGFGMQAHYSATSPSGEEFKKAVNAYCEVVDHVQITELDFTASDAYDGTSKTQVEENRRIAARYKEIYDAVCELNRNGRKVTGLTVWGVMDKTSWLNGTTGKTQCPMLFDNNYEPKKAFYVLAGMDYDPDKNGGSTGGESTGGGSTGGGSTGGGSTGGGSTGGGSTGGGSTGGGSTGGGSTGGGSTGGGSTGGDSGTGGKGDSTGGKGDVATTTETKPDGTKVETTTQTTADKTTTTVTETKTDGSVTETKTETKTDGTVTETKTETKADGSTVESVKETVKNGATVESSVEKTASGEVVRTTETTTKANGKVTEKTVIAATEETAETTVTVKRDKKGEVTSATAALESVASGNEASLDGASVGQIVQTAGTEDVTVTMTVKDDAGNIRYQVEANATDLKAGNKLCVYKINAKTGQYVMVNAKNYPVDSAGSVTVSMSGKGTYGLVDTTTAKQINKEIKASIVPKTEVKTMQKGKTASFKLDPGANKGSIKSITYKTGNKSFVTVDKNGKMTAKASGTTTVKAKVTLKNGTTKTIKMKISVK